MCLHGATWGEQSLEQAELNLDLPFAANCFVAPDKSPIPHKPQFCHLQNESDNGTYFVGFVERIVQVVFS